MTAVPADVAERLKPNELNALHVLLRFDHDHDGRVGVSARELADALGHRDHSTAAKYLRALVASGVLTIHEEGKYGPAGTRRATVYGVSFVSGSVSGRVSGLRGLTAHSQSGTSAHTPPLRGERGRLPAPHGREDDQGAWHPSVCACPDCAPRPKVFAV